ncbi:MAG TPA: c-type cytochrome domain-containing protein [Gemmataceae bacterium]|nr:c-type cytochrome domain-containing protein [Gemmataceae bacterium]
MPRSRLCVCVLCAAAGLALALGLLALAAAPAVAQAPPKKPVSFINEVAPILKENCFACHNAKKRKGKFEMTTFETLRKGGGDDPVTAGRPEDSDLFRRITTTGARRMPPKDEGEPLARDQAAVIRQWIQEGAKLDAGLEAQADLMRELRLRWKPPAPKPVYDRPVIVTALAFTPDNKQLVVGGQHELTVWDVAGGKLEKRIATRAERAKAMVFLPDGKLAVAGSRPGQEGDVRIYNLQGGTPKVVNGVPMLDGVHDKTVMVKELLETDDEVLCLAVSADGKKLASGGCDRLVCVWDLSAGYANAKLEQTIENHADWVLGVVFSPDGQKLLTASRDKTAKMWDLKTKESVLTFPDHQNGVFGVAIKSDGKIAASVGQDNQVRYWNATADGKQIRASGGHGMEIYKVIWHPKLPILVTCSADKTVRIWNPDSGAQVHTLSGHTDYVYGLALSSDGKLVASGSWNGEVKIWNVADGKVVKEFNASPGLPVVRK